MDSGLAAGGSTFSSTSLSHLSPGTAVTYPLCYVIWTIFSPSFYPILHRLSSSNTITASPKSITFINDSPPSTTSTSTRLFLPSIRPQGPLEPTLFQQQEPPGIGLSASSPSKAHLSSPLLVPGPVTLPVVGKEDTLFFTYTETLGR